MTLSILSVNTILLGASSPVIYILHQGTHYNYVIMSAMASQVTSLTVVYSTVYSRRRSKKTSKLCVTGPCTGNSPVTGEWIHRWPANSQHKGPVTRKIFPIDDVIMYMKIIPAKNNANDRWTRYRIFDYQEEPRRDSETGPVNLTLDSCTCYTRIIAWYQW